MGREGGVLSLGMMMRCKVLQSVIIEMGETTYRSRKENRTEADRWQERIHTLLQTHFQLNYGFEFGNRSIMQLFELLCMSLDKYPVGCIKDTIQQPFFSSSSTGWYFDLHSPKFEINFHVFMMVMRGYELTNKGGIKLTCTNLTRVAATPTFTRKC